MLLASSASHSGSDIDSAERYQLNVNSQTVEQALRSLANASSRQLLFPYDQMEALKSISISGRYTLEEALGIILKDTSLSGELTTEGVILVTPIQKKSDRGSEMKNRKKILAATIGFFVGAGGSSIGLAEEV
ncbi:MAG: STN domain-containing protein, partial [Cellvibrionales bacterium]|nr:STN domain-containing protein [Cellvibrionales bacterium]